MATSKFNTHTLEYLGVWSETFGYSDGFGIQWFWWKLEISRHLIELSSLEITFASIQGLVIVRMKFEVKESTESAFVGRF